MALTKVKAGVIASDPITVGINTVSTASSITATANTHVNVSAAGQTIKLPSSPSAGQRLLITVGHLTNTVVRSHGNYIL